MSCPRDATEAALATEAEDTDAATEAREIDTEDASPSRNDA